MEAGLLYSLFSLILLGLAFKFLGRIKQNLPPSPAPCLPFLGHIYLLRPLLHRVFQRLSQKLGPIFSLQFGKRFIVVISSPTLAEECFIKNDIVLANRPRFIFDQYIGYNYTSLIGSPYGDHWRNLRRLTTKEVFSSTRLDVFTSTREDELRSLLRNLYKKSKQGFARVELRTLLSELTFNNIMRMVAGKRYFGEEEDNEEAKQVRELIEEVFKTVGVSNPADFFPFCRWIDYNGIEKKLAKMTEKFDNLLQSLIDEHRRDQHKKTMISHLLQFQESHPDYYTDALIKGIIMVLLLGGTDTTLVAIEWAMSALLNHPEKIEKARAEIESFVGNDRLVIESDVSQLPYLQNIISEALRLFPPGPLLIPHESSNDCKIGGYDIPRGTILLVNAWAIHRDPTIWEDPLSFKPERFEVSEVGPPKLLPFGMGRRACPGIDMARRTMGLAIGSFIQCFEWQRLSESMIDLTEGIGMSMPKAAPMEAKCKARNVLCKMFGEDS